MAEQRPHHRPPAPQTSPGPPPAPWGGTTEGLVTGVCSSLPPQIPEGASLAMSLSDKKDTTLSRGNVSLLAPRRWGPGRNACVVRGVSGQGCCELAASPLAWRRGVQGWRWCCQCSGAACPGGTLGRAGHRSGHRGAGEDTERRLGPPPLSQLASQQPGRARDTLHILQGLRCSPANPFAHTVVHVWGRDCHGAVGEVPLSFPRGSPLLRLGDVPCPLWALQVCVPPRRQRQCNLPGGTDGRTEWRTSEL